jgi:5-methylcytosine-specific restriction endonuclease McrA
MPDGKKTTIPRALREQVWRKNVGDKFESKCFIDWCTNRMTVFDFHVGHNRPESKGGATELLNLKPICSRCNLSMGNTYTIEQWNKVICHELNCRCEINYCHEYIFSF